jgi:hypothetical protein
MCYQLLEWSVTMNHVKIKGEIHEYRENLDNKKSL